MCLDNLIAQVNELIEDKMSVETFSEGEYLPSVRQVVQDLHSFGVGVVVVKLLAFDSD
jgi:DNA-binding transcriptional regulator YhcF (GntR family)